jgi:tetrahydromethanopterin S-methyltransferase subunit G
MNDDGEDDSARRRPARSASSADIALLHERQRGINKRIDKIEERIEALEKKQGEVSTLMNKALGAAAIIMGIGAVIGWLVSVGGNVLKMFR